MRSTLLKTCLQQLQGSGAACCLLLNVQSLVWVSAAWGRAVLPPQSHRAACASPVYLEWILLPWISLRSSKSFTFSERCERRLLCLGPGKPVHGIQTATRLGERSQSLSCPHRNQRESHEHPPHCSFSKPAANAGIGSGVSPALGTAMPVPRSREPQFTHSWVAESRFLPSLGA